MNTFRTGIARLTTASALALALGASGAGPASASYSSWAGSVPPDSSVTFAADDDASPDGIGKPSGIKSAEDGASPDALILAGDFAPALWA